MLDILGWKGIWRRHEGNLERVLNAASAIRDHAANSPDAVAKKMAARIQQDGTRGLDDIERRAPTQEPARKEWLEKVARIRDQASKVLQAHGVFLSDTLVIGVWSPEEEPVSKMPTLGQIQRLCLASTIADVLQLSAIGEVPLNFRGVVVGGQFLIDQNLILGPAVDAAASLMEKANSAIVWYATERFMDPNDMQVGASFPYDVPLKDGRSVHALVVNPFFGQDESGIDATSAGMLGAFRGSDNDLDVAVKRQNTERFLTAARNHTLDHYMKHSDYKP